MLLIMVCILGVFVCILLYCGLAASKNAEAQWKELERKVYEKRKKKNKQMAAIQTVEEPVGNAGVFWRDDSLGIFWFRRVDGNVHHLCFAWWQWTLLLL